MDWVVPTEIYFSQFQRLGRQDKVPADSVPGEGSLPSCCILNLMRWRERALVSSSSWKDTNPIMGAPFSWPYLNLIASQRPHLQIPSHWGQGFNIWFWGYKHLVHNREVVLHLKDKNLVCKVNHFYSLTQIIKIHNLYFTKGLCFQMLLCKLVTWPLENSIFWLCFL